MSPQALDPTPPPMTRVAISALLSPTLTQTPSGEGRPISIRLGRAKGEREQPLLGAGVELSAGVLHSSFEADLNLTASRQILTYALDLNSNNAGALGVGLGVSSMEIHTLDLPPSLSLLTLPLLPLSDSIRKHIGHLIPFLSFYPSPCLSLSLTHAACHPTTSH